MTQMFGPLFSTAKKICIGLDKKMDQDAFRALFSANSSGHSERK
jgi:hypothetical protein